MIQTCALRWAGGPECLARTGAFSFQRGLRSLVDGEGNHRFAIDVHISAQRDASGAGGWYVKGALLGRELAGADGESASTSTILPAPLPDPIVIALNTAGAAEPIPPVGRVDVHEDGVKVDEQAAARATPQQRRGGDRRDGHARTVASRTGPVSDGPGQAQETLCTFAGGRRLASHIFRLLPQPIRLADQTARIYGISRQSSQPSGGDGGRDALDRGGFREARSV